MNHQEVREFCAAQGITPLAEPTPFTPAIDPRYEFRKELLVEMVAFWLTGKTSMKLMGYKGCGKTTLPEQFHAALNYPLLSISCTPRTEASDLIGKTIATPEGLKYSDGPLVMGAKFGCSVMLDEYNVMDPGEATGANKLLEGGAIYIPETGEVVRKAPGFRIFASCNPADKSLGFFGRNEQDQANDDRFWTIWVDYPKPEDEAPIVQRKDLPEMLAKELREELFYMLSVVSIQMPSLKARREDIPYFIDYFLELYNEKYNKKVIISGRAQELLIAHNWPGNINELKYIIQQLVFNCEENIVLPYHLPESISPFSSSNHAQQINLTEYLEYYEKRLVLQAYQKCKTTVSLAKYLGISQATAVRKLQKYLDNDLIQ